MAKNGMEKSSLQYGNSLLLEKLGAKSPLVVVHRGVAGGSLIENTTKAVSVAVALGADVVEIDVIRSTDGEFFVFHDGYERLYFDLDRSILELSSREIEGLQFEDFVNRASERCGPERLSTFLVQFPDTILNLDRSWPYWDTLLDYLDRFNCTHRILLKGPVEALPLALLSSHSTDYPFLPIVNSKSELELVLSYPGINIIGVEILAASKENELARIEEIDELHQRGLLVLLNAINLPSGVPLFLGWDDETSVLGEPDRGWGRLIVHGADMIQTDWPGMLNTYIHQRNRAEPRDDD